MSEATGEITGAPQARDAARTLLTGETARAQLVKNDGGPMQEHRFVMDAKTGGVFIVDRSVEEIKANEVEERHHRDIVASLVTAGVIENREFATGGYCMVDGDEIVWAGDSLTIDPALPDDFENAVNNRDDNDNPVIRIIDQDYGKNIKPGSNP